MRVGFLRADRWALSDRAALGMAVMVVVGWTFHTLWNPPAPAELRTFALSSQSAQIAEKLQVKLGLKPPGAVDPAPAEPSAQANVTSESRTFQVFITRDETAITLTYAAGIDGRSVVTGVARSENFSITQRQGAVSVTTLQFSQTPLLPIPSAP